MLFTWHLLRLSGSGEAWISGLARTSHGPAAF